MELIKYKSSYKACATELLSLMITDHTPNKLKELLQAYEENDNHQLYLWKKGDHFIGIIGIELANQTFAVRHIAVSPSARNKGIGSVMVEKVQQLHEPLALCSTSETKQFLTKCWNRKYSA